MPLYGNETKDRDVAYQAGREYTTDRLFSGGAENMGGLNIDLCQVPLDLLWRITRDFPEAVPVLQVRSYHCAEEILRSKVTGISDADCLAIAERVSDRCIKNLRGITGSSYETYLRRSLISEVGDVKRRSAERAVRLERNARDRAEEDAYQEELQWALKLAISRLPTIYQDPINLHHFEGFSVDEVARILRVTVGCVKSRLARGRRMLWASPELAHYREKSETDTDE